MTDRKKYEGDVLLKMSHIQIESFETATAGLGELLLHSAADTLARSPTARRAVRLPHRLKLSVLLGSRGWEE